MVDGHALHVHQLEYTLWGGLAEATELVDGSGGGGMGEGSGFVAHPEDQGRGGEGRGGGRDRVRFDVCEGDILLMILIV